MVANTVDAGRNRTSQQQVWVTGAAGDPIFDMGVRAANTLDPQPHSAVLQPPGRIGWRERVQFEALGAVDRWRVQGGQGWSVGQLPGYKLARGRGKPIRALGIVEGIRGIGQAV